MKKSAQLKSVAQRQRQVRGDAPFGRAQVLVFQHAVQADGLMAAVRQADAGAAGQITATLLAHIIGQPGPQQGDDGAAAVIFVHARAADLDDTVADAGQPAQVEFVFRIQAGQLPCLVRWQHAVGAHQFAGLVVFHDQVVAVRVVLVTVDAVFGRGQLGAHFLGKHLVTQLLCAADVAGTVGDADTEFGGGCQLGGVETLLHRTLRKRWGCVDARQLR